jgi:decaprenylphospho-beta-D-erythro-pentofuranosid-2-ulose 2-reductase
MRKVLIVGATSAIAEAVARIFAERGDALVLVGRNTAVIENIAMDLRVRGAKEVGVHTMDANELAAHEPMLDRAENLLGGLDTVLIAYGTLGDQKACERSATLTVQEIGNNGVSVTALLTHIANRFEQRRAGSIAVISSVAGDRGRQNNSVSPPPVPLIFLPFPPPPRGRQSNYVYGSAKALVTAFLSGLRQRLYKAGVAVITIEPGFVDTPMTAAFRKGFLWAKPQQIATGIVRAIDRSASVVYLPGFWRPIMLMIRSIPESLFRRLQL